MTVRDYRENRGLKQEMADIRLGLVPLLLLLLLLVSNCVSDSTTNERRIEVEDDFLAKVLNFFRFFSRLEFQHTWPVSMLCFPLFFLLYLFSSMVKNKRLNNVLSSLNYLVKQIMTRSEKRKKLEVCKQEFMI